MTGLSGRSHDPMACLARSGRIALDGWARAIKRRDNHASATLAGRDSFCPVPTALRIGGLRFFFFSNEGTEPPHIHVETGDGHAKFWLEPVTLAYSTGMSSQDLKRARLLVMQHVNEFKERWREHFGT